LNDVAIVTDLLLVQFLGVTLPIVLTLIEFEAAGDRLALGAGFCRKS